jgi:hypothetical protein
LPRATATDLGERRKSAKKIRNDLSVACEGDAAIVVIVSAVRRVAKIAQYVPEARLRAEG